MNSEVKIQFDRSVTPEEVVAVRETEISDEARVIWRKCLDQSLCVVSARDGDTGKLLGIGFLAGNQRHAELVDLTVHSTARKKGIGSEIVKKLVDYAHDEKIPYFGLTFDIKSHWLKDFYEKHGFRSIDFGMWDAESIDRLK